MSNTNKILKECDGLFYEFVRNKKGTLIKKCCASCKHKDAYDTEGPRRLCRVDPTDKNRVVNKKYVCREWEISEDMDMIKTEQSRPDLIKNKDYGTDY
jgi:hypothetical protein